MFVDLGLGARDPALVIYIPPGSSKVSAAEWKLGALDIHTTPRYKEHGLHRVVTCQARAST